LLAALLSKLPFEGGNPPWSHHDATAMVDALSKRDEIYAGAIAGITIVQLIALGIVVFFYLLDSLLAERKDRSILFWKSLPISDAQVVLSKALTALVLAPLFVVAVGAVSQILLGCIGWLRFHDTVVGEMVTAFNPSVWLQVQAGFLVLVPAVVVWYLPIAAYLMLVSVWARKNAFLWAVLPPAAVALVDGLILHTLDVGHFLARRFAGVFMVMDLDKGDASNGSELAVFVQHVGRVFTHYETWLGVLAAAVMFVAVVRIRRYRDDS